MLDARLVCQILVWRSATWNLPRRNRFRVLAAAGSLVADDAVAAVDATAVASDDAAAAAVAVAVVAPVAGTDTGTDMGIGIGTAATGTGIDIGDWVGVFGVALPGPAVPYRWDDMYHQKPGLAVCLYVVFNHSFRHFASSYNFVGGRRGRAQLSSSRLPPLRLDPPYLSMVFYPSSVTLISEVYSSRADRRRGPIAAREIRAQKKWK